MLFFIVSVSNNKSQVLPSLAPAAGVKDEKLLPYMNSLSLFLPVLHLNQGSPKLGPQVRVDPP